MIELIGWIASWIGIWIIGFAVVVLAMHFLTRSEPTAHGRIIAMQIGCVAALLWPVAVPAILIMLLFVALRALWEKTLQ